MRVYIAGPYSSGDQVLNVKAALDAAEDLVERGHIPFVPHLTAWWHFLHPKPYRWWIRYDNVWLLQCEAVVRLPGESPGADEEVALARSKGIPVYYGLSRVPPGDPDDAAAFRGLMREAQRQEAVEIAAALDRSPEPADHSPT